MAITLMKLHWSPKSPYVRKVMICAQELGLADRMELIRSVAASLRPSPSANITSTSWPSSFLLSSQASSPTRSTSR